MDLTDGGLVAVWWLASRLMHQRVAIVTDSTASLPPHLAARLGVRVVPLQVIIGQYATDEDRVDRSSLIAAMQSDVPVATAEPPAAELLRSYQEAELSGYHAVVSIHISGRLSRTCEAAREAAARSRIPVHVVDSLTSGLALGFLVTAAVEAAHAGAKAEEIVQLASTRHNPGDQLIYVDTLEYLRRGGRIGGAAAWLGSALAIKPLLGVADGVIVPVARVRGTERALNRLVDVTVERAGDRRVDAGVEHVVAPERAEELADRLRHRLPQLRDALVTPASTVIAAHLGPGAIAMTLSTV